MEQKNKLDKKVWGIVLCSAVVFATLVILATCALFDSHSADVDTTDWKSVVQNSAWTFNRINGSTDKLIPALASVKDINITSDDCLVINYGSFSFNAGLISFNSDYSYGTITVRQAASDGYDNNNLALSFSESKDGYALTMNVQGIGALYFFY